MMPMSSSISNSSSGSLSSFNKKGSSEDNINFPGQWRFSQCFGDKTETLEVAEGIIQILITHG